MQRPYEDLSRPASRMVEFVRAVARYCCKHYARVVRHEEGAACGAPTKTRPRQLLKSLNPPVSEWFSA